MRAKTTTTVNAIDKPTSISGLTFTPSVSSSKNLRSPALAAGIGADFSFFFLLTWHPPFIYEQFSSLLMLCYLKEFLFSKSVRFFDKMVKKFAHI